MIASEGADSLRGLHQDLIALSENRLANVDRLWGELEAHIDQFKQLLDKKSRTEASRQAVYSGLFDNIFTDLISSNPLTSASLGTISLDDVEYAVNAEFRDGTIQLADALDLDELEASRLFLAAQEEAEALDRSVLVTALIHFHAQREFMLDTLRLILYIGTNQDTDEPTRDVFHELITMILETKEGPLRNGSLYAQKCLVAMGEIEKWLQGLAERIQGALALGQALTKEHDEVMSLQQKSLNQQHESLAAVLTYLVKENFTMVEDFYKLLDHVPILERWTALSVHYVPILLAFTSQYGSPEGGASRTDARSIHTKIMHARENKPWILVPLQAATIIWWLAEYSGWYTDQIPSSPLRGVNLEAEAQSRSDSFFQALNDGAFQCMLSICFKTRSQDWYDPAKVGLIDFLLRDSNMLPQDALPLANYLQDLMMEQLEGFAEAFITNMPDALRKFKTEEDDQRRQLQSGLQLHLQSGLAEQDLHLERFLVIMSYAYEGREDAAQSFWTDRDGNLHGFLQWASRRQSTPCVSAFCETFRAISEGPESAEAAHRFLLEENTHPTGRIRKASSLSWAQMFGELHFYALKIREHPTAVLPTTQTSGKSRNFDVDEPESAMMLECYLRLTSHLCCQSQVVRNWILSSEKAAMPETLLALCQSSVPKRIQACVFTTIRSLLIEKDIVVSHGIWTLLDQWCSGGFAHAINIPRPAKLANPAAWAEELTFEAIANDFEESNAFVAMLQTLLAPVSGDTLLKDILPFPEQIGSAHRMPGVEPYIDFVLGTIFSSRLLLLEDSIQLRMLSWNTLHFISTCLGAFNEDLLIIANKSAMSVDSAMSTSSLLNYARLHPFHRTMEWMFNDRVLTALFAISHQDINEISQSLADSPLIMAVTTAIEVMDQIMTLQSTYLDVVRPLIKLQTSGHRQPVIDPSLTSFEDFVANNLRLILDLGLYCGSGHRNLVLSSLSLLGKLSASRKLNVSRPSRAGVSLAGNRLIGVLSQGNDLESIVRSLNAALEFDLRELNEGPNSSAYAIKVAILDFIGGALAVSPEKPNIAHALLGFSCRTDSIAVADDSMFSKGMSVFHAILRIGVQYPNGEEGTMSSWALSVKRKALEILGSLRKSTLTSECCLAELNDTSFLTGQFLTQVKLDANVAWDGLRPDDPDFLFTNSALALEAYLQQRCSILEYTSAEMRLISLGHTSSQNHSIISTVLGSSLLPTGEQCSNLSIFDLLDFLDLKFESLRTPQVNCFAGVDFSIGLEALPNTETSLYNLRIVEEVLALRRNELVQGGRILDPAQAELAELEAFGLVLHFTAENNQRLLKAVRIATLVAWADTLVLLVNSPEMDQHSKTALVLQAAQLLSPKFEAFVAETQPEAFTLAKVLRSLLSQIGAQSTTESGKILDVAKDKLYEVFRVALRAINVPDANSSLREVLYNICYCYLLTRPNNQQASFSRTSGGSITHTIKSAGDSVIDIISDDAYGGDGTSRIAALLLLTAMVVAGNEANSRYLIEALVRANFIIVLVESIGDIPQELQASNARGMFLRHRKYRQR